MVNLLVSNKLNLTLLAILIHYEIAKSMLK